VTHTITPGTRLTEALLSFRVRSTRSVVHPIGLPANVELEAFRIDGVERAAALQDNILSLALEPGEHQIDVEWRESAGLGFATLASEVNLGARGANVLSVVKLPSDRWLWFASGPLWGPAVLFWGYLLVVLLGALMLGRLNNSPMTGVEWCVLGMGLTQVPTAVGAIVVGWFFIFRVKRFVMSSRPWKYNLLQVFLIAYSVTFVALLAGATYSDLVLSPDMQVAGMNSSATELRWYSDRISGTLPRAGVISVSIWVWRVAMLAWALWLASKLLRWLGAAWAALSDGGLWRRSGGTSTPPRGPESSERVAPAPAKLPEIPSGASPLPEIPKGHP
jgi:hypothetical protein